MSRPIRATLPADEAGEPVSEEVIGRMAAAIVGAEAGFVAAMDDACIEVIDAWRGTDPADATRREALWAEFKALERLVKRLRGLARVADLNSRRVHRAFNG